MQDQDSKMDACRLANTEAEVETLFGVKPYPPSDALMHACGILDVIKQEWGESWTEHDQKVRAGLSAMFSPRNFPAQDQPSQGGVPCPHIEAALKEALDARREAAINLENGNTYYRSYTEQWRLRETAETDRDKYRLALENLYKAFLRAWPDKDNGEMPDAVIHNARLACEEALSLLSRDFS